MAKKSLTDLLREEVQKSPDLEAENAQEITAVEESPMNTPSKPGTRNSSPTKADLETTVAQLTAALEKAKQATPAQAELVSELKNALTESQEKESSLQQQITELQSELKQQKQTVEKLQAQLEKLDPLKIEFEQAKTAALQLAQVNEKLTQEIDTLKQEKEKLKGQGNSLPIHQPGRPIQKELEKSDDFAKKAWLL